MKPTDACSDPIVSKQRWMFRIYNLVMPVAIGILFVRSIMQYETRDAMIPIGVWVIIGISALLAVVGQATLASEYTVCEEGLRVAFLRTAVFLKWEDIQVVKEYTFYTRIVSQKLGLLHLLTGIFSLEFRPVCVMMVGAYSNYRAALNMMKSKLGPKYQKRM